MAKQFTPVKVLDIRNTTDDSVVVSFEIPEELRESYRYKQGQYLTLRFEIDGEKIQRSYSLCSCPLDNEWQVAIKKVPFGKFSVFANDVLEPGQLIELMPPDGRFYVDIDKDAQRNYIAFAAGSGITPIISIIKTHLTLEPKATFKLFYVNKTANSIMLKEELEALKNKFMDRLEIFYFLTRQKRNIELLNGRIDEDKLDIIFKTIADIDMTDHYFICGPEQMIFRIRDYLIEKGVDKKKLHFELFTSSAETKKQYIKETQKQFEGKVSDITVIEGGKSLHFKIPQGSDNILDAALAHSADLPFACKGGVCCTCKAKLLEGKVNLLVNYGLEEEELKEGYILSCQAIPVSEKIVVDFDR